MSEQRFKLDSDDENEPSEFFTDYGDFWEDGTPKTYWFDDYEDFEDIVDLLNEQQSEINSLKMELELISGEKLFSRKELERKVDEQQATITALKEENEQLKQEVIIYKKAFQQQVQRCTL